jgi:hypothetical protein
VKKFLVVALLVMLLTGCSFQKVWKWLDEMEWEREDQTVKVVDFILR